VNYIPASDKKIRNTVERWTSKRLETISSVRIHVVDLWVMKTALSGEYQGFGRKSDSIFRVLYAVMSQ